MLSDRLHGHKNINPKSSPIIKGILILLVLTRRINESIVIFPKDIPENMTVAELFARGNIEIEVLGVQGGQIRLGFGAPKELAIFRTELEIE